jgi:cellulose synthase/poly-beta-1,6-N-acetylglucosamine synthase-like glycosyltransferase
VPPIPFWCGVIGTSIIGATWVIYPGVVGLLSLILAWTRRPSFEGDTPGDSTEGVAEVGDPGRPSVSVILATRDPGERIRRRVKNLRRTEYPPDRLEIVVALDATAAHPDAAACRESPDMPGASPRQILDLPERVGAVPVKVVAGGLPGGKAATLNSAVESAIGELLVFIDTNQRFSPSTIPELVRSLQDPEVGGVSGSLVLRRRRGGCSPVDLYWSFERWLRRCEARIHSPVGVTGAVSGLRSRLWKPLRPGLILDDVYTPMRIVMEGHRVAFATGAVAFETRRSSPRLEHTRKTRTLTGVMQLCAWFPEILVPWKNPLFFQFLFHKLFRLLTPLALLLLMVPFSWALLLLAWPPPLAAVIALAALLLWIGVAWPPPARAVRAALAEIILTQGAVVKAIWNGLRGRWDVWT